MIAPDQQLTEHFTLYELTRTGLSQYQTENRMIISGQIFRLRELARLGEKIRSLLGAPLVVHSGYRCPVLNKAVGSTERSQHLLAEAMDFVPKGLDIGKAFRTVWAEVKAGQLPVGQLIFETAQRPYGETSWIHVSLGTPYRAAERCNQVLRMEQGKYSLFNEATV